MSLRSMETPLDYILYYFYFVYAKDITHYCKCASDSKEASDVVCPVLPAVEVCTHI